MAFRAMILDVQKEWNCAWLITSASWDYFHRNYLGRTKNADLYIPFEL